MLASYKWLNEYVDLSGNTPEKIGEILTGLGLELEEIIHYGTDIENVVTGNVLKVEKHPNADKLSVCEVEIDKDGTTSTIVCGAKNVRENSTVFVAKPGAILKDGFKIKKAKLRGVTSNGMICSLAELGYEEKSDGIFNSPEQLESGIDIIKELGLSDTIFNIDTTPNRPDCLSIIGIARELALYLKKDFNVVLPELDTSTITEDNDKTNVIIDNPDLCNRYCGIIIKNVTPGQSPLNVFFRLLTHNIRPINYIVDFTNYVLLEYGHPLHSFDKELLADNTIHVRTAKDNETIELLDENEYKLDSDMLIISDNKEPIAIAGIMGGEKSGVTNNTKEIFIESAYFNPASVRKTIKKLGISSEAGFRFERGTDIIGLEKALVKCANMILKHDTNSYLTSNIIDEYPIKYKFKEILLRNSSIKRILDIDLNIEYIQTILNGLNIDNSFDKETNEFKCIVPANRPDLEREIDLIEEITRHYGYQNLKIKLPPYYEKVFSIESDYDYHKTIKEFMVNNGFNECINYSFVEQKTIESDLYNQLYEDNLIEIANPVAANLNVMRPTLLNSIIDNALLNIRHFNEFAQLFEIGKTYVKKVDNSIETNMLSGLIYGDNPYWQKTDIKSYFVLKGYLDSLFNRLNIDNCHISYIETDTKPFRPGRAAKVMCKDKPIGYIGELMNSGPFRKIKKYHTALFEINLDILKKNISTQIKYVPYNTLPITQRDFSLLLDKSIPVDNLIKTINKMNIPEIKNTELFDIFYDNEKYHEKKVVGLRIKLQGNEKTLSDNETNKIRDDIYNKLNYEYNVIYRPD